MIILSSIQSFIRYEKKKINNGQQEQAKTSKNQTIRIIKDCKALAE